VNVIGHDDEGMKLVVASLTIVLDGFQEEFGIGGNLEESSAIVGRGSDEKRARA
jgi:hypothetical protein